MSVAALCGKIKANRSVDQPVLSREIVTGRGDVIAERFLAENLGLNLVDVVAVVAEVKPTRL